MSEVKDEMVAALDDGPDTELEEEKIFGNAGSLDGAILVGGSPEVRQRSQVLPLFIFESSAKLYSQTNPL